MTAYSAEYASYTYIGERKRQADMIFPAHKHYLDTNMNITADIS